MEKSFGQGNPAIASYTEKLFRPIDAALAEIRQASLDEGLPEIQVGAMDGRHLEILSRMLRPQRVVEIGTLGGYSGLCLARGMAPGGVLHTFEKVEKHALVANRNLEQAKARGEFPVELRLHIGSAIENLRTIENEGPFDLVFIDADKQGYPAYLEWAAANLRVGGIVLGDNTFAWGDIHRVHELSGEHRDTVGALDEFNRRLAEHPRFRATILPTAEGLTLGVKVR